MKKLRLLSVLLFGFTLLNAQADLKVESISYATEPAICGPGLPFPVVYITIKNDGNKPAIGTNESATYGYMIDLILSGDTYAPIRFAPLATVGRYPEDCLLIGGRISNTVTIQPYQTYTYKMPDMKILAGVDLRNPCGLGKFNIGVVLDPGLKVPERSETNNTAFKEFKLVCR